MGEEAAPTAAGPLQRAQGLAYWLVVAPLVAFLPAVLAYRIACFMGDLNYRLWPKKRSDIVRDVRQLLGDEFSAAAAERLARDLFRYRFCDVNDVMRLRGKGRALGRLLEIRGRENLEAALAEGKGAILCTAHFGSYLSAFSVLHASGFPVTTIGRWDWNYDPGLSSVERRLWDFTYARRVLRHRKRPNIEPWPGRPLIAVQAAASLRAGELVTICSDAPPLPSDRNRAIEVPFLGGQAKLLPGVVTLARLSGAPVLMAFVHHSPDYRHRVLEISPPVPMHGETDTAFGRCSAAIEDAIRRNPAHWTFWFETSDLDELGLLPSIQPAGKDADPQPALAPRTR